MLSGLWVEAVALVAAFAIAVITPKCSLLIPVKTGWDSAARMPVIQTGIVLPTSGTFGSPQAVVRKVRR